MVDLKRIKMLYLGLLLLEIKDFFGISNIIPYPNYIDDILSLTILGIFFLVIIFNTYFPRDLIICIMLGGIALYSGAKSGYMIIALTVLTIIAIREESLDKIAKFLFKYKLVLIIVNTIMALLLWGLGLGEIGRYYESGTRFRLNLGYGLPGHLGNYIFNLMILWIWIHYEEIRGYNYISLLGITFITYLVTDSRLVFLDSCILIILVWIIKHTNKFDHLIAKGTQIIIPVLTVFMFMAIKWYGEGKNIGYKLDAILNSRVRLNGYNFSCFGVSWLGRKCEFEFGPFSPVWHTNGGIFDCAYTWLVVEMGIIWLILLEVGFFLLAKRRNSLLNVLLIVWAFGALIDTDYLSGIRSFPVLFMTILLNKQNLEGARYKKINNKYDAVGIK